MGHWIILTKKVPAIVSPPKLSIFYAEPWPAPGAEAQLKWYAGSGEYWNSDQGVVIDPVLADDDLFYPEFGGAEPNLSKGLRIRYKGEDLRVWAHECNILPADRLNEYLSSNAMIMMPQNAGSQVLKDMFDDRQSELRLIFDAAILDGASYAEALFVALGMDLDNPAAIATDIFWFRCHPEYAKFWCTEEEMQETDKRPKV